MLHQRFGKLPWSQLFADAIDLAQNGFHVGEHLETALKWVGKYIKQHQTLR